jgi:hypothetical protein
LKFYATLFLTIVIFLSACTPEETATPTLSARETIPATERSSPIVTATKAQILSTITTTPTPAPFLWLHPISLKYIAPNEAEATIIANSLGYLSDNAHPSNMCGPLAGVILRDGSIISYNTDLKDFWLLNPRTHDDVFAKIFPEKKFELTEIRTPLNEYNFSKNPLSVGDFLYLYAGPNGNFDHMLTVTRVDEDGRAYTVTNINTDDGYIIDEFMLYDPNAYGEGLFYRWNNRDYDYLGLTGSGGFDIWRPL